MQVIIFVPIGSAYSQYNGKTFPVKDAGIGEKLIPVIINGQTVDFSYKEVVIVNFHEEFSNYLNAFKPHLRLIQFCKNYADYHNINVSEFRLELFRHSIQ